MSRLYVNAYGDGGRPVSRTGSRFVETVMMYSWNGDNEPDGEFRVKLLHYGNHVKLLVFTPEDNKPVCTINHSIPPAAKRRNRESDPDVVQ